MGHVLIDATGAAVTVTLPAATAYHDVLLRRADLTANVVLVSAAGADKIMLEASAGQATAELLDFGDFLHLRSDAAGNWWRIAAAQRATETYRGTAKVATQVLTDAGADDKTVITPKKLRWGFAASLQASGYIKFPSWLGGLIIQWGVLGSGNIAAGASENQTWNFPIQFPNECLAIFGGPGVSPSGVGNSLIKPGAPTLSSCPVTAYAITTGYVLYRLFAIGR